MKKTLAMLLALVMVFGLLAGCGGGEEEVSVPKKGAAETVTVEPGKYQAVFCEIDGEEYYCDQDWLEIEAGGEGVLVFEGEEYPMDWELKGSTFTFEDVDGSTFEGTYADGVIEGVLDGSMEYIFELAGSATKVPAAAEPEPEPVTVEPGKYQAIYCAIDGEEYYCEEDWLEIEAGGEGVLVFEGEDYPMDWEFDGNTFTFEDVDGSTFEGTYADGVIEGVLDGNIEYVFAMDGALEAPAAPEAPAAAGDFTPVSGTIGDHEITIVGAELFEDIDDKDAIRFYWDFTNNSDETVMAETVLDFTVEQEGFELATTYDDYEDDVPEYGNGWRYVRPGATIRCISEFSCKAGGDVITFTITGWWEEEGEITAVFDPAALPGRPAKDWAPEPVSDPSWTDGLDAEGNVGDEAYVEILEAELVPGWEDDVVLRVYYDFTNKADEASSMLMTTDVYAYQDGIQLNTTWAETDAEEEELFYEDIEPGESLVCAEVYQLRSDSPVEIVVGDWEDEYIGTVIYLDDLG